jgi:hypothetical protein
MMTQTMDMTNGSNEELDMNDIAAGSCDDVTKSSGDFAAVAGTSAVALAETGVLGGLLGIVSLGSMVTCLGSMAVSAIAG